MRKTYDVKRIRIHVTYTVDEAAALLGVNRATILQWGRKEKDPLPINRYQYPWHIKGSDLKAHVLEIHASYKSPLKPGKLWCMRCKRGCAPANNVVIYNAQSPRHGTLTAPCANCGLQLYRGANPTTLTTVMPGVTIISKGAV